MIYKCVIYIFYNIDINISYYLHLKKICLRNSNFNEFAFQFERFR